MSLKSLFVLQPPILKEFDVGSGLPNFLKSESQINCLVRPS